MPKPSINTPINEADIAGALSRLNLFYADESRWCQTWVKKEHGDLFDMQIPIDTIYYKRSIGRSSRPLMILSGRSLARLYHCLSTANAQFDVLAEVLADEARLLIEEADGPETGGG